MGDTCAMAKRKRELALFPPLKRQCEGHGYPRCCPPLTPQGARKRKPELVPCPEAERLPPTDGTAEPSQAPAKKPRTSESQDARAAADFQCQKDEAFRDYNSFQFWRTALPDLDFSELDEACDGDKQAVSTGTDVLEEMDN